LEPGTERFLDTTVNRRIGYTYRIRVMNEHRILGVSDEDEYVTLPALDS
jgi:hypothetical protein